MKAYQFLLFDADGTLLDFDRCEEKALRNTLTRYRIDDGEKTIHLYHQINADLWERFNLGEIDRAYLLHRRFGQLCEQLNRQEDPAQMNRDYMEQLSRHADLLEESAEICNILCQKYKLYIITNGASLTQHGRFAVCPLTPLFEDIFISEDMGVQKPQKAYFDAVAAAIPGFDPDRALVIGDSLSSDMQGANNAGLDCCWYNPQALPNLSGVCCTYEIRRLRELLALLP
ncbi:MAG: YjjG family noncanonical pyrimidine nucleotidase [Oscillospiraceae bacterium]|nr:YjjG family noncanonical pyrimidine nucleotidase [Oscillospiraceae bacterium]